MIFLEEWLGGYKNFMLMIFHQILQKWQPLLVMAWQFLITPMALSQGGIITPIQTLPDGNGTVLLMLPKIINLVFMITALKIGM